MSQIVPMVVWFAVLFIAWGYALGWTIDRLATPVAVGSTDTSRRRFLLQLSGGIAALTLIPWGIASLLSQRAASGFTEPVALGPTPEGQTGTAEATSAATEEASNFAIVPGTRPEITANKDFYRVDVNIAVPQVNPQAWTLTVGGLVDKLLQLNYKDITSLPAIKQYATLECISNYVGGDLISTTQWTGVKLGDLLKMAGLKQGVVEIKFTCEDGYTESLPLESAMDERTLLAYHMNDEPLLPEHGFPLRVFTPNRYGMKNPKWVVKIEAISQPFDGYWELGGWDKQAIVKSTSVIDTIAVDQAANGEVPVGGIAFSGARGISKVELAVDGGPWQEAELKKPISPLTWTLWRFNWKAAKGHHQLRVRTVDGQGQLQIEQSAPLHPDGASGYVSQSADIS
jgi:DMSO/TMAO reductase YedYZ molybdopterin-dependent catalytic subunit